MLMNYITFCLSKKIEAVMINIVQQLLSRTIKQFIKYDDSLLSGNETFLKLEKIFSILLR